MKAVAFSEKGREGGREGGKEREREREQFSYQKKFECITMLWVEK